MVTLFCYLQLVYLPTIFHTVTFVACDFVFEVVWRIFDTVRCEILHFMNDYNPEELNACNLHSVATAYLLIITILFSHYHSYEGSLLANHARAAFIAEQKLTHNILIKQCFLPQLVFGTPPPPPYIGMIV